MATLGQIADLPAHALEALDRYDPDRRALVIAPSFNAFLAAHCDRARVMPFLEGIPCSIHGVVFPDGVAVLRPVEMVTLRAPGSSSLRYCGAATFWDPPGADRQAMRALARRVGASLRTRVGYRGAFTIDGVLAEVVSGAW